jgi:hypothetical protein
LKRIGEKRMDLNELMIDLGDDTFYDKDFMDVLEAHMSSLRESRETNSISVDSHAAVVYTGDLYGYLNSLKINPSLHWIIMRVSGLFNPFEFGVNNYSLRIPSSSDLDKIHQLYLAVSAED